MTDQTKELAPAGPGTAVGQHTGQAQNMLAMIAEAARDPTVDAQKMVTLADLALKLKSSEQQEQFNRDKVAALIEMPFISRRGQIVIPGKDGKPDRVQSRFAKFEDIMRVVKPILASHNLAIDFKVGHSDKGMVLVTPVLSHRNGTTEAGEQMAFPIDTSGSKNNTQGVGSASSYGKRQSAKAMLNIVEVDEDDDGQGAGGAFVVQMNAEQAAIIREAEGRAAQGGEAYQQWFDALPPDQRGWLVVSGHHEQLKPKPKAAQGGGQTKRTPEQLVDAYVAKTQNCQTLDQLREFQADPGTQRFVDGVRGTPALFSRITDANAAAYDRLAGE